MPAPLAPSRVTMLALVEREVEAVQCLALAVKRAQPADLEHHVWLAIAAWRRAASPTTALGQAALLGLPR